MKYLFFDIDGTLVAGGYENQHIPESARKALDRLGEAGHFLAIATGRSEAMARDYMYSLGFDNMVCDGGYGVVIEDKLLGITPLDKDAIVELVRECQQKGFPWGLQVDNSKLRQVPDNRFYEATHDVYMGCEVVLGLDPENYDVIYKAYVACAPGEEKLLRSMDGLPYCRSKPEYIFVEPSDKSVGIKAVMDHFHAPYSDVIVFGDGMNDISMFCPEWTCVAMGNAIPELKEKADLVTTDIEDDGIWNACVSLGLFNP